MYLCSLSKYWRVDVLAELH